MSLPATVKSRPCRILPDGKRRERRTPLMTILFEPSASGFGDSARQDAGYRFEGGNLFFEGKKFASRITKI